MNNNNSVSSTLCIRHDLSIPCESHTLFMVKMAKNVAKNLIESEPVSDRLTPVWCMWLCWFAEDGSGYYRRDSGLGPQLEAVVTIPIHHGRGAGAKGQDKPVGYIYSSCTSTACQLYSPRTCYGPVLVSVCLPQVGVLSKRLDGSRWFLASSTNFTLL